MKREAYQWNHKKSCNGFELQSCGFEADVGRKGWGQRLAAGVASRGGRSWEQGLEAGIRGREWRQGLGAEVGGRRRRQGSGAGVGTWE